MDIKVARTRQLVVELDNRPGMLGKLAQMIGTREINILGYAAVAHGGSGTVHLITDNDDEASSLLEEQGYNPVVRDALVVETDNEPGRLGQLAVALGKHGVNIESSFVTAGAGGPRIQVALTVDDTEAGDKVLRELASAG